MNYPMLIGWIVRLHVFCCKDLVDKKVFDKPWLEL